MEEAEGRKEKKTNDVIIFNQKTKVDKFFKYCLLYFLRHPYSSSFSLEAQKKIGLTENTEGIFICRCFFFPPAQHWFAFFKNMKEISVASKDMNYLIFYISSPHLLECPWDIFITQEGCQGKHFQNYDNNNNGQAEI